MHQPRNKPNALPWIVVACIILVIGLVMYYKRASNAASPAPVSTTEVAPDIGARPRPVPHAGASAPSTLNSIRERKAQMMASRKQVQERVNRTQATFAAKYREERVDAAWAGPKEAQLTKLSVSDQIQQLGVQPQNLAVDCKSSMCFVTATFPTMSAGDDWVVLYMNNLGDVVPAASYKYSQNADGTVTINVYALGRR